MKYPAEEDVLVLSVQENLSRTYNLDERLVEFAGLIIDIVEQLPKSRAGNHIAGQLLRSGTSPAANYAEACAAESRRDFLHKMGICLKELRESHVWLRICRKKEMLTAKKLQSIPQECEELVRIFNRSIETARENGRKD
jgi:four helix bundle protein